MLLLFFSDAFFTTLAAEGDEPGGDHRLNSQSFPLQQRSAPSRPGKNHRRAQHDQRRDQYRRRAGHDAMPNEYDAAERDFRMVMRKPAYRSIPGPPSKYSILVSEGCGGNPFFAWI